MRRYLLPVDVAYETMLAAVEPGLEVIDLEADLTVLKVGVGPRHVAVKANAHADEPAGVVTALEWARRVPRDLRARVTFHLLPTANPRGLERNRGWLDSPRTSLQSWFLHVSRDLPAEDREFGYGATPDEAAHPECRAWHAYLDALPRLDGYLSLHSMAFAGGALCLLSTDDLEATAPLRASFRQLVGRAGLPLNHEDRGGRKGFWYVEPGWWTAPTREEMEAFLNRGGGQQTWLRLNSLQVVRARHGTPVALVSELPQWWCAALCDETPHPTLTRAQIDRETGTALAELARELEALGEPAAEELAHRLAAARALVAAADDWGDRPATLGDRQRHWHQLRRVEVANAALRVRLQAAAVGRPDAASVAEFHHRLARFEAAFEWQALSLDEQVELQLGLVETLARHVCRED